MKPGGRRGWLGAGAALAALAAAAPAAAIPITLATVPPTPATLVPGSSVFVEISVSGLAPPPDAPSLTSFELDLAFSDAVVDFVDLTFGVFLGATTCTPSTFTPSCDAFAEFSHAAGSGVVELGEATLLDPALVNANQPAAGVLATLEFLAVAEGTTTLSFTQLGLGGTISGTQEGSLSGTGGTLFLEVVAPEPGAVGPLLLGLGALGALRFPRGVRGRKTASVDGGSASCS
jgi:hypothetical protein